MNGGFGAVPVSTGKIDAQSRIIGHTQYQHFKVFIHFANLFVERFPNWKVTADPVYPFNSVRLVHPSGQQLKVLEVGYVHLSSAYGDDSEKLTYQATSDEFATWALGVENVPDNIAR